VAALVTIAPAGADETPVQSVNSAPSVQQESSAIAPPTNISSPTNDNPAAAPSVPPAASGFLEAGPGPLLDKRKALLTRIMAAKKQGIGTSAYLGEFNRIEEMVKSNQPVDAYEPRLDSLSSGLDDQLKRSEILKSQRPVMITPSIPVARSNAPGGMAPQGGVSSGNGQLMDMLRSKYGSKLGSGGLGALDKISPAEKEKLLHSDMAKELMKKYLGN
jgi:hypothetical protein